MGRCVREVASATASSTVQHPGSVHPWFLRVHSITTRTQDASACNLWPAAWQAATTPAEMFTAVNFTRVAPALLYFLHCIDMFVKMVCAMCSMCPGTALEQSCVARQAPLDSWTASTLGPTGVCCSTSGSGMTCKALPAPTLSPNCFCSSRHVQ